MKTAAFHENRTKDYQWPEMVTPMFIVVDALGDKEEEGTDD